MSITSTRRVTSSTTHVKRNEKNYAVGSKGESFVEVIDTNNNVLVRDENSEHKGGKRQAFEGHSDEQEEKAITTTTTAYVSNTIEALAASGVYEAQESHISANRVNVYGNNQSIIKDEEAERAGHSYLKHFYEKNELLEEVDELI